MEAAGVGIAVAEDDTARPVGVADIEVRVGHELSHSGQYIATAIRCSGLQGKPLVQHQVFVLEQGVKTSQSRCCKGVPAAHQGLQCVGAVRHVAGVLEALQRLSGPYGVARLGGGQTQVRQRHAGQCASPCKNGIRAVAAVVLVGLKSPLPVGLQRSGELHAHGFANSMDALGVDHVQLLGDIGLAGERQHQFLEGGIQLG